MTSLLCCLAFAAEGGHVATSLPKPLSPELPWLLEGSPRSHVGASRAIPKPGVPPLAAPKFWWSCPALPPDKDLALSILGWAWLSFFPLQRPS